MQRTLWLWGPNPKCLTASRAFFGPLNNSVFAPVGALKASWSIVKHSPPASAIRALAVAVKRNAAIDILGTTRRRLSSVTVPMMTTVLLACSLPECLLDATEAMRERDIGGRLMRDMKRRRRTVLLNFESVRPITESCGVRDGVRNQTRN
jgi:hypothetical protein